MIVAGRAIRRYKVDPPPKIAIKTVKIILNILIFSSFRAQWWYIIHTLRKPKFVFRICAMQIKANTAPVFTTTYAIWYLKGLGFHTIQIMNIGDNEMMTA